MSRETHFLSLPALSIANSSSRRQSKLSALVLSGVDAAPDSRIRRAAVEVKNGDLAFINNDNLGDSLVAVHAEADDVNGAFRTKSGQTTSVTASASCANEARKTLMAI